MEPILDETSLVPCAVCSPGARIRDLARMLQSLDAVGCDRKLRSVRDAADRDLGQGRGLRAWCFDRSTPRDEGRLVAARLAMQPFVDGPDGLFAREEGRRAVEAKLGDVSVDGLGLAALTDGLAVLVTSDARPTSERATIELTYLDDEGTRREEVVVRVYGRGQDVDEERIDLTGRLDRTLRSGADIVRRLSQVFPHLVLGERARTQIASTTGSEPVFLQLVRHLRALDEGAKQWGEGPFIPAGVSFSVESPPTLQHGAFGPLRDFPTPAGFPHERWSLHTKLTGGNGARMYFRPAKQEDRRLVLVGYFGEHLPTVNHPK